MKILFDFVSYQISAKRGVGRYILAMYEHMVKIGGFESYILISNKYPTDLPDNVIKSSKIYTLEAWEDYNINTNFDFFFQGNFFDQESSPLRKEYVDIIRHCNQIVGVMYDLIPLVFAKNYLSGIETRDNYAKSMNSLNIASHLFAISECSRQDCIKLLGMREQDITTIYGSTDEQKFITKNSGKKYNVKTRTNNIVCVPGDDLRKNYTGAVRGFCMAYKSGQIPLDAKLYLICKASNRFESNVRNVLKNFPDIKIGKQIIITGYVSDDEMVNLLSNARSSIFPSFYEGLGLPILESYIAGTPSIGSALSSTKDLLLPECSFNPYNDKQVADAIVSIYNDENLCQRSLDFGENIIKTVYNWDNSARIILDKLRQLKKSNKPHRIAVFSTLPPDQSGIAGYTYKLHSTHPDKYDLFGNIRTLSDYDDLLKNDVLNVFPYSMYEYIKTKHDYIGKIFVFGNSPHHGIALEEAMKTFGEKKRFAYLHEAFIVGTFLSKFPELKEFLKKWYPFISKDLNSRNIYEIMRKNGLCGIRPLIEMTGIRNFIVNNETAKSMITEEIEKLNLGKCNIHVFFHPVPDLSNINKDTSLNFGNTDFVIGSFGIPGSTKRIDDIIRAVNELNKDNHKIKLLLAGYNAKSNANTLRVNLSNTVIIDNPTDDELLKLMKSVDLAIQLRKDPHGESSGCIAQLLGMGQNLITQYGFVPHDFENYCTLISASSSVQEIKSAILSAIYNKKQKAPKSLIKQYSFDELAIKIENIVKEENE